MTALFVVLLVWGDLPRGLEEFLPISLGTGILIMGAELIRNTAAAPISKEDLPEEDPADLGTPAVAATGIEPVGPAV